MRKAKFGMTAMLIIGIVFTILGATQLLCGLIVWICAGGSDGSLFLYILGGNGLIFFTIGVIFLIYEVQRRTRSSKLINSGNYILAEITDVGVQYHISVGRRHPYVIWCQYQDAAGIIHAFKSREIYQPYPFPVTRPGQEWDTSLFLGQKVKVYVEDKSFKHYYVDIDEMLPRTIVH